MTYDIVLIGTPQPTTLIRNCQSHPKLYAIKREESNMDNNFGYDLNLSENTSEQLKKRARPEKDLNMVKKVVTVDPVIMLHQLHHC